ncbi:DUF4003 family protein [Planomicrobium sp. CPCC 101079]|uniref:DUF4003 family protein n=1 Tax=Planomicrobium sp. CPCC 101079 TaxID=2599618 RepID=UPI0011B50A27|nr:DUF4003 family protein [Planomicrobium sp. CPCC 101079]TWT02273.1 DUF4003 family protein [Planomicrobium sp. CPCC 101079]
MDIKIIEKTYGEVARSLGWTVDKRISLAVAIFYLTQNGSFPAAAHEETSRTIKKNEGWFSPLQSHMHHIAAAHLTLQSGDAGSGLKNLNEKQRKLNEAGFRKSQYTYLAALLMEEEGEAEKAKELYDAMRNWHKVLTSSEDVPYAVLLGRRSGGIEERAATMNAYYKELRERGFYMGNDLQWLSQIMTFHSAVYDPKVVGRVLAIKEFFQSEKIKIRGIQYPVLGLLAVAEADGMALRNIAEGTRLLEKTKLFKWYKDLAFSAAVQCEMRDAAAVRNLSDAAFSASLELLMQAQQAVMMTSINAAIMASNNNSSSS